MLTVSLYKGKAGCERLAKDINDTLFKGKKVTKCLRVQVIDEKAASDCGTRIRPSGTLRSHMIGYVAGRNIKEFRGCGLIRV